MRKFRLQIEADIKPIDGHNYVHANELDWTVPHASASFEFHSPADLREFLKEFGDLLGAQQ